MKRINTKKFVLLTGDILILYSSLAIALMVRYGFNAGFGTIFTDAWIAHQIPFLWIHLLWLTVFFSAGMYDWEKLTPSRRYYTGRLVLNTMLVNFVIAITLFYVVPFFNITPKTNLIIDVILATILVWQWRVLFLRAISRGSKIKVIFFGSNTETKQFVEYLEETPSLGYTVTAHANHEELEQKTIKNIFRSKEVDLVVIEPTSFENKALVRMLYEILPTGITIVNFTDFYEHISAKIPTSLINETWFFSNLPTLNRPFVAFADRALDITVALLLFPTALALTPLVATAIILDSRGTILFRQKRVGKNGKVFELIKFRSMIQNAEEVSGLKETTGEDMRVTRVGKFLRASYLDELPQLINILRGEMSFVGPRPERPEFVEDFKHKVLFYEMRLLVNPGMTGWAQINMENDASVEDAPIKLQYDLYYIKNRTPFMNLTIMLRTASTMLRRAGR
jgi:exopolysaccharide biosynthesis polyprenyl glycosylphosphotransferase